MKGGGRRQADSHSTPLQLPYPQLTLRILEGSVDLRRYPSPVSGTPGHGIVHSLGSGVETPIVSTLEEVDLVLLRTPDQGGMDGGPLQAQLGERCRA